MTDGPEILRPTPQRPFNLNFLSPTPPNDESSSTPSRNLSSRPQWLDPDAVAPPADAARRLTPFDSITSSLSRPQSFTNLTASALAAIYSPTPPTLHGRDDDEDSTPWGTGAHTPVRRPGIDDATYELMRDRSHNTRRRSSHQVPARRASASGPASNQATAASLALRAVILFILGIGYGFIVTRVRSDGSQQHHDHQFAYSSRHGHQYEPSSGTTLAGNILSGGASDWWVLSSWGITGVALGALLPWVDKLWENTYGVDAGQTDDVDKERDAGTDWALVMRAIGAFVGIVYAIRKVAWTSTMQISVTLALTNPLLWWLIDRSQPGFLLSTAVGLTGSALMLGVSPDMMPAPLNTQSWNKTVDGLPVSSSIESSSVLSGLASQHTVEYGIWAASVLFCSCVCFGNIGRRLAWNQSAVGRGRWGG